MEPPATVHDQSSYSIHGETVENMLINEKRLRESNQQTRTKIFWHQIEAALETTKFLNDSSKKKPALIIAPTGSGKTGILGLIPYLLRSKRTVVLTPSPIISEQIKKSLAHPPKPDNFFEKTLCLSGWSKDAKNSFLPNAKVVSSTEEIGNIKNELIIVNAQKLGGNAKTDVKSISDKSETSERIVEFLQIADLLIVDEAHHFPAPTWERLLAAYREHNQGCHMVFITATVERMWENKLHRILSKDHESYVVTKECLEADVIRRVQFEVLTDPTPNSDIISDKLKRDLVEQVGLWLRKHDENEPRFPHQAMILVGTKKEAIELQNLFNSYGDDQLSAVAITGETYPRKIDEFKQGGYRVAIVCRMLIEGYDNPYVSICVVFRRVKSQPLFKQFLGRCLRRNRCETRDNPSRDQTTALMMTYDRFDQRKHFDGPDVVPEKLTDDDEQECFIRSDND